MGTYFEPHNLAQLASILENYSNREYTKQLYDSYEDRMKSAAYEFLAVFK
jgi:hypothetical protein